MDAEGGRGPDDPQWAPGHAQLSLVDGRRGVEIEPAVGVLDGYLDLQPRALSRRLELALDVETAAAMVGHPARAKAHFGVVLYVEEGSRAQVPVAPAVAGVEAGGVQGQLHAPLMVVIDLQPAVEALEATLVRGETPEVGDAELGARARRVELPARAGELPTVLRGMGGAHVHFLSETCRPDHEREAPKGTPRRRVRWRLRAEFRERRCSDPFWRSGARARAPTAGLAALLSRGDERFPCADSPVFSTQSSPSVPCR